MAPDRASLRVVDQPLDVAVAIAPHFRRAAIAIGKRIIGRNRAIIIQPDQRAQMAGRVLRLVHMIAAIAKAQPEIAVTVEQDFPAMGVVLAAPLTQFLVPAQVADAIDVEAVRTVLNILSSSLLAVTIFSLTTMATSLKGVSDAASPRARPILIRGGSAQNAIATFLGAFIFSVIGLVALNGGLLGAGGEAVLFALTVIATLMVVIVLIQWIRQLSTLGDVEDAISKVDHAAQAAFRTLACLPGPADRSTLGKGKSLLLHGRTRIYLKSNIWIEVYEASKHFGQTFVLGCWIDNDAGGWVGEYAPASLDDAVARKSAKANSHNDKIAGKETWLILVDRMGCTADDFANLVPDFRPYTSLVVLGFAGDEIARWSA